MNEVKSRGKVRAVLAGGLVLGVGAAVTLAAWNDSVFAEGTFGGGSFNLQGTTNGNQYFESDTAETAGSLFFELDSENLAPGDVTSASFAVRLDGTTTSDALVVIGTDSVGGALAGLTYELISTEDFLCDIETTGTVLVPAGTALGTTPADVEFALTEGVDTAAGAPVNLCFRVTATDALPQGQAGSTIWSFTAESI